MKWQAWFLWLAVGLSGLLLLVLSGSMTDWSSVEAGLGRFFLGVTGLFLAPWACWGIWQIGRGDGSGPAKTAQFFSATALGVAGLAGFASAASGTPPLHSGFVFAISGMFILAWAFVLALAGAGAILGRGGSVAAVARTVLQEAIRMKVALAFCMLLVLLLPILPLTLRPEEPLRYRVQTFLTYSLVVTAFFLNLMTIFLACSTLSREIAQMQIYTVATKPIGRGRYLLGKWLGIVVANGVLLGVAALAIWGFALFYLARLPANNELDAISLYEEVLVARQATGPTPARPLQQRVEQRLAALAKSDPQTIETAGRQVAASLGLSDTAPGQLMELGMEGMRMRLTHEAQTQWLSVGPRRAEGYLFQSQALKDLRRKWVAWREQFQQAQAAGRAPPPAPRQFLQFRYKMELNEVVPRDEITIDLVIQGRRHPLKTVVNQPQTRPLPVNWVDDEGRLEVVVVNGRLDDPDVAYPTITFPPDGLEVLCYAGSFTGNFFRGMLAIWAKLAFLAMLGLACATFLGFPVASLLSLLVFFGAWTSPFILESTGRGAVEITSLTEFLYEILRMIGQVVATLLSQFSHYNPSALIADGRLFGWDDLAGCIFWVGFLWTLLVGTLAWIIFRRRELARVQV